MSWLSDTILNRWLGWDGLISDAGDARDNIKEKIVLEDVYVNINNKDPLVVDISEQNLLAWGQYIDSDSDQRGIYGTGMACQILTIGESTPNDDFQKELVKAENWLINEWLGQISGEIDKYDYAIIFKHAWFLNGLGLVDNSVDGIEKARENANIDELVDNLWEKRNANGDTDKGWSRYWYKSGDETETEDKTNIYSSLITLWALLQVREFDHLDNNDYWDILIRIADEVDDSIETFKRRQVGSKKSLLTQAGLCVYILCEYRDELQYDHHQNPVSEKIASLADSISNLIESPDELTEGEYEIHLFTTPKFGEESNRYDNQYVIFMPKPIVGLALIEAGKLEGSPYSIEKNRAFIEKAIKTYVREIGTDGPGAYATPETGHAAIGDHVWLTRFLHSFSTIDKYSLSLWRLVWYRFKKNALTNVIAGLLFVGLAAAAGWITFGETTFSALSAGILLAVAAVVATQLGRNTFGPFFD